MIEFISSLPDWVQALIAWLSTGGNLVTMAGVITALIKLSTTGKQAKLLNKQQADFYDTLTTKLVDTKTLVSEVMTIGKQVGCAVKLIEESISAQKQSNANLAKFVMECFNKSNLTPEAKAELRIIADEIFYDNNTEVVEALKKAKVEADTVAENLQTRVIELENQLAEQKTKLAKAQENVRINRRV